GRGRRNALHARERLRHLADARRRRARSGRGPARPASIPRTAGILHDARRTPTPHTRRVTMNTTSSRTSRPRVVSYVSTFPTIRLRGQWLTKAGFAIGTRYTASIVEGQIVLAPMPEPSTADTQP